MFLRTKLNNFFPLFIFLYNFNSIMFCIVLQDSFSIPAFLRTELRTKRVKGLPHNKVSLVSWKHFINIQSLAHFFHKAALLVFMLRIESDLFRNWVIMVSPALWCALRIIAMIPTLIVVDIQVNNIVVCETAVLQFAYTILSVCRIGTLTSGRVSWNEATRCFIWRNWLAKLYLTEVEML